MIFALDDNIIAFPNPKLGEPDGALAIGGDLSTDRLMLAYSHGIFPWYDFKVDKRIIWYCPMQRFVIVPQELHISHSLRTQINKDIYTFSFDRAFADVINHCATVNGRITQEGAWLGPDLINAFIHLHKINIAHSVEVWRNGQTLVGGLYGVLLQHCFVGDSMFSLEPSGSKLALVGLCHQMINMHVAMIDCQLETPHLKSMGGRHISYDTYMSIIRGEIDHVPVEKEA